MKWPTPRQSLAGLRTLRLDGCFLHPHVLFHEEVGLSPGCPGRQDLHGPAPADRRGQGVIPAVDFVGAFLGRRGEHVFITVGCGDTRLPSDFVGGVSRGVETHAKRPRGLKATPDAPFVAPRLSLQGHNRSAARLLLCSERAGASAAVKRCLVGDPSEAPWVEPGTEIGCCAGQDVHGFRGQREGETSRPNARSSAPNIQQELGSEAVPAATPAGDANDTPHRPERPAGRHPDRSGYT